MAAVFALIIVPLVGGLGFFLGLTHAEHSAASAAAAAMFFALSTFVVYGLLRIMKDVDADETQERTVQP